MIIPTLEELVVKAEKLQVTSTSTTTKVSFKDGLEYYGFFNAFDDYVDLRLSQQYRFIEVKNVSEFRAKHRPDEPDDKTFSRIIDLHNVLNIELIKN